MMGLEGLPKLPGYSFPNIARAKHNVPHQLTYNNGYMQVKKSTVGIGGEPIDALGILYQKTTDPVRFDPSLTYGRSKTYVPPVFRPHFVLYDKKCLTFRAFFKQSIHESPQETYRVRRVNIIYFLEDDTITVIEPPTPNAGFPQGRLVTRSRIPRGDSGSFWHWKDLNVAMDMDIYGVVYHICSCDGYTKEYLTAQGMELNEDEELPSDPYIKRRLIDQQIAKPPNKSKSLVNDKLYRYLEYDRKILRFDAIWDDDGDDSGDKKLYTIRYFLVDDTIEVAAGQKIYHGEEPFNLLIKRIKIPKKWNQFPSQFAGAYLERTDDEVIEYYGVGDFVVGNTVSLIGRKFIILDCDPFTRRYYSESVGIEQPQRLKIPKADDEKTLKLTVPAYKGFGTVEDSITSWYHFDPKPPKTDVICYLENQNKKLRYTAILDWVHPEDQHRNFLIEYRLSDGTIAVHELPSRNSGFVAGKFLKPTVVPKLDTNIDNPEYISPIDIRLGKVVYIFGHRFVITGVDLAVYRYMEANPEKFSPDHIMEVKAYLIKEGFLNNDIKDLADFRQREAIEEPAVMCEEAPLHVLDGKKDMIATVDQKPDLDLAKSSVLQQS